MCVEIPEVRVGSPIQCGAAEVFPLFVFRDDDAVAQYILSDEAVPQGITTVEEVSETGAVPNLIINNHGGTPVLFLEGGELCGGKQARVLNLSVLAAPRSLTVIPVTCVERNRWTLTSPTLGLGSYCPPSMRSLLRAKASENRNSDQIGIWAAVERKHRALGVPSATYNLSDALESRRDEVEELRAQLPCPEGASGIAVTLAGKVVCIDLFDNPETLTKTWHRLALGIILDAMEEPACQQQTNEMDILAHLYRLKEKRWQLVDSVGLGEQYLSSDDDGTVASALVVDGRLVHASAAAHIV
jgi:hypothetical protein